ncbi:MAG: phospholipase D-like domain-containing protein [Bacteriovoracia bacterium]
MPALILCLLFLFNLCAFADEVDLLIARKNAKYARMDMIFSETKEIRYNTYVFDLDDTGKEIIGLLTDAAQRGVKVKLVIDDWEKGLARNPAYLQALQDLGVEVKVFNPLWKNPIGVNYRNHIKSLIGSQDMIVGGRNTQGHYYKEYIDVEARIKGDQVTKAREHFDEVFNSERVRSFTYAGPKRAKEVEDAKRLLLDWAKDARHKVISAKKYPKRHQKVENLTYHADPPGLKDKRNKGINKEIIKMIDRAENSLDIMNPYVLLTTEERAAIIRARERGVKIRVSTNGAAVTDSKLFGLAWEIKKNELLALGVDVHESKQYIHAKTIIRDGQEVFIGSFNLDPRSHNLNLENGIFFKNKNLAEELTRHNHRIVKMFTHKLELKIEEKKMNLKRGARCIRNGLHSLITAIVYPIL